jgi:hypothetical protein
MLTAPLCARFHQVAGYFSLAVDHDSFAAAQGLQVDPFQLAVEK